MNTLTINCGSYQVERINTDLNIPESTISFKLNQCHEYRKDVRGYWASVKQDGTTIHYTLGKNGMLVVSKVWTD